MPDVVADDLTGIDGAQVRRARLERDPPLSGVELAAKARVSTTHISLIETGRRQPSVSVLLRLAAALEVPVESLFTKPKASAR
jgi:transcriptional regulator with XRE-family HTH domain